MQLLKMDFPSSPDLVLRLLEGQIGSDAVQVGTAKILQGERVPQAGFSSHAQHELSVILSGRLKVQSGDWYGEISSGDITIIPAQEEHSAVALEDTTLFWVWFGTLHG